MARNKIEFALRMKDEASHNIQKVSKEVDALSGSLKRLGAGIISIGTGLEIAKMADKYRLLQNRLRLVTKGTEELAAVTEQLTRISLRSRTSFQSTLDLYARVARSSRTLGKSQQELLDFTETVSKSIRISGSTSQEAAAGVIQFGQALASSRLSGDELRSVLEQMPRLAQAIAEGMKVGIGQLREMGEEGTLSAEKVLKALEDAGPAIAAEFAKLKPLVSEAFTNLESAVFAAVGKMDEFAGASVAVAATVLEAAEETLKFGEAMTGSLDPADQLAEATKRLAIFLLVVSSILGTMAKSLVTTFSFAFRTLDKQFDTFIRAWEAIFDFDFATAKSVIGKFFKDVAEDGTKTFSDFGAQIEIDAVDTIAKIVQVIDVAAREMQAVFDLSVKPEGDDDPGRKERDRIKRVRKEMEKLETDLVNQMIAIGRATRTGEDYTEVLQEIEVSVLAASIAEEEWGEALIQNLRNFNASMQAYEDAIDLMEEQQRIMEQFSKQAARNIQDAFADFLFDPFEDGVKGMVKGFLDALRRMLANLLAFQILSNIPGIGGFLSQRAAGGPVSAGQPVLVGERGPELFIPGASGSIRNNSAMNADSIGGGSTFITNIDARGADPGLIARLPTIMEQRDKKLMLKMKRFIETGSVTI